MLWKEGPSVEQKAATSHNAQKTPSVRQGEEEVGAPPHEGATYPQEGRTSSWGKIQS
jgi:hypothetical protein